MSRCCISRAYDAFCDRELDDFYAEHDPEPMECSCCNEPCDTGALDRNGECSACAAENLAWATFCGPLQPAPAFELYPNLASVHQLPSPAPEPLPLRAAA